MQWLEEKILVLFYVKCKHLTGIWAAANSIFTVAILFLPIFVDIDEKSQTWLFIILFIFLLIPFIIIKIIYISKKYFKCRSMLSSLPDEMDGFISELLCDTAKSIYIRLMDYLASHSRESLEENMKMEQILDNSTVIDIFDEVAERKERNIKKNKQYHKLLELEVIGHILHRGE